MKAIVPVPDPNTEIGYIDETRDRMIIGWAYDKRTPETPVTIRLFIDAEEIGVVQADQPRGDLVKLGVRNGYLGFRFALPEKFSDVPLTRISACFALTGTFLRKSTKSMPQKKSRATALVGKEGWLFLCRDRNDNIAQYRSVTTLSPQQLDTYKRLFAKRQAWFTQQDIPHLFFIIPGKEYLYPEYLPDGLHAGPIRLAEQLIGIQRVHGGLIPIDLLPAMLSAKQKAQIFYKLDTHWNHIGAFFGAAAIMEEIRKSVPRADALKHAEWERVPTAHASYDLAGKLQMDWQDNELVPRKTLLSLQPEEAFRMVPKRGARAKRVPTPAHLQLSKTRETEVFETGDASLPSAIFFHDSFAESLRPYLAECFRRSVFMWQPNVSHESIKKEKPDIVAQLCIDRFLIAPPAE